MFKLFIVPTPIGNLEDVTFRAIKILKESDLILAEDTRKSNILLKHYGINKPVHAHHKFNEHQTTATIIQKIQSGLKVAVISEAGTPGISDPGFLLVRECLKENVEVECLPGATAVIPALIMSGLPCDRFVFEGFLPHKKGRQTRLKILAEEERTIILYESPHRIHKTLIQLVEFFGGERKACLCREMTKMYEEILRGTLVELEKICQKRKLKGEMVLVIEGKS